LLDKSGKKNPDLRLTTLENYISICKEYDKQAILELKSSFTKEDIGKIISIITSCEYLDHVSFISFNYDNLLYVREYSPKQSCMYLFSKMSDDIAEKLIRDSIDVAIKHTKLKKSHVEMFHNAGLKVNCWTVDDKDRAEELAQWGVETVKNIELMDIRDSRDSKVIQNIMAKKKSQIEMESRTTVAENSKKASQAEIEANKEVALKQQDAEREVGLRTAEVNQEVGIANEKQKQQVQEQAKVTAEKEMEVKRVQEVKAAEIEKQAAEIDANKNKEVITINAQANVARTEADKKVAILNAEANKEQTLLDAEAQKQKITLKAEADLVTATNEAKGIEAKGKATAQASELAKKASVQDQVTLAEKVGENKPYQDFLIQQKQIEVQGEVMKAVGVAQAQNLSGADIKMFVSSGSVPEGVSKAAGIFNPDNALNIASMLEAFKSTPMGAEITDKLLGTGNAVKTIETIKKVSEEVKKKAKKETDN
jgi:hypothetical protein